MSRLARILSAGTSGLGTGLALGPISLLAANASDSLMRGWSWPEMNSEYAFWLVVTSLPAGINGALGAVLAAALGRRRRLDITLLPVGLHVVAGIWALLVMPYLFVVYQLFALTFAVVVWPAGRLGQMIGIALRGGAVRAAPDPSLPHPSDPSPDVTDRGFGSG